MTTSILLIPKPDQKGALMALGVCGSRPPKGTYTCHGAWRYVYNPLGGVEHGRTWCPRCGEQGPWQIRATEDQAPPDLSYRPCGFGLVLAYQGKPVTEGIVRALPIEDHGFAWLDLYDAVQAALNNQSKVHWPPEVLERGTIEVIP